MRRQALRYRTIGALAIFALAAITLLPSRSFGIQIKELEALRAKEQAAQVRAQALVQEAIANHVQAVPMPDDAPTEDKSPEEKDEPIVDTAVDQSKRPKISDQFAQLHLRDGSIIGGELATKSIDVKTSYGMLKVPISRIVQFYPGLDSNQKLKQKISDLVESLGGPTVTERDKAQKELIAMGLGIRGILTSIGDGGDAERKKQLNQIYARFDEVIDEAEDEVLPLERSMIFDDTIVTPDFSIVGKIQQKEFRLASKYGALTVTLDGIKLADRIIDHEKTSIRKSIAVPAMAFFQTTPKSTGIRVNKGDRIKIRADGVVQWTNWSSSSTPDGLSNRSQWNGINSGTLTARIGSNNSHCVKIGSSGEITAKSSGVLYLGIAMRDSYANNGSYTWTGEYKAKITVDPKSN